MRSLLLLPCLILALIPARAPAQAEQQAAPPTIAAAAALRDTLPALADAYARRGGPRPRLSFGASGNLRRQIAQGAPFSLFLSADEGFVLDLAREGHLENEGEVYALGRLAILVPRGSPVAADGSLADLAAAIHDGRLERLAVANPDHAPYGRAARQVLEQLGLWGRLRSRLAVGENVSQAVQFTAARTVQAGIVAYSLALSPRLSACCSHAPIASDLHAPLRQRGALVAGHGREARDFFTFLLGPQGRALLMRGGFGLPDPGD